jgi:hypothetical protein
MHVDQAGALLVLTTLVGIRSAGTISFGAPSARRFPEASRKFDLDA